MVEEGGLAVIIADDEKLSKLKKMGIDEWRDAITNLVHSMRPHVFSADGNMMWQDIKTLEKKVSDLEKPVAVPNLGYAFSLSWRLVLEVWTS